MGNMNGTSGSHYTLWQSITQNYQHDIYTNVTVRMYLTFDGSSWYAYTGYQTSGNMMIDGTAYNYTIPSINFSSGQAKDLLLAEWTGDIEHDHVTGEKILNVSGSWNTDTTKIGSGTCSASQRLTTIPRYANITSFNVSNISGADGLTKVKFDWSADSVCDHAWYSIDGGDTWYGLPTTNIVSGLSPNTAYNFKLRIRRQDSQLTTDSEIVTKTTYDIARISQVNDFKHGDEIQVKITNPANISELTLEMKVNNVQILTRKLTTGSNSIQMTDTELDNLYKQYGTSNSLTAVFILSAGGYTDNKQINIFLTGNQKTVYIEGKRAKVWVGQKRAVAWINVKGIWKRGI